MANKHQVLALLEKGLTPQQIAKKLKCLDAYVRAVRAREFGNGREQARRFGLAYYHRNARKISAKRRAKYREKIERSGGQVRIYRRRHAEATA